MRKVDFGSDKVSCVCLGTMMMGTRITKEDSYKILNDFTENGGNFLDTSDNYSWWWGKGNSAGDESESILWEWMSERKNRSKIFLATKFGARPVHPDENKENLEAVNVKLFAEQMAILNKGK